MADLLNVMIIDDEDDYATTLKDRAAYKNINLVHKDNLEDGLTELYDNYSNYDGLILDGRGYLSAEEKVAKDIHVFKALKKLDEFDREGKIIPRIINTGYFKDFQDVEKLEDIRVFDKSGDEDEMFNFLVKLIKESDMYKYRKKYPAIFNLFTKKYFPQRKELELVRILNAMESKDSADIKGNLAIVRTFLEPLYKSINTAGSITGDEYLPNDFFNGDEVNLFWCEIYATGREVRGNDGESWEPKDELVDNHIGRQLEFIRTVCNKAGSHDYSRRFTNLTLASATYALLDVLNWYHNWLDSISN